MLFLKLKNKSYVTYLINNYLSEDDKVYLLGINKNVFF